MLLKELIYLIRIKKSINKINKLKNKDYILIPAFGYPTKPISEINFKSMITGILVPKRPI